jgi:hypothetical protein
VVIAALPLHGKQAMEKWLWSPNQDVKRIMRANLKKDRLVKIDKEWVEASLAKLR